MLHAIGLIINRKCCTSGILVSLPAVVNTWTKATRTLFYLTVHGTVHHSREVKAVGAWSWRSHRFYSQETGRRMHAGVQTPLFTQLGSPASAMFPLTNKVGLHMLVIIRRIPHKHAQRPISQVTLHPVMLTINIKQSQMAVERSWRRNITWQKVLKQSSIVCLPVLKNLKEWIDRWHHSSCDTWKS